MRRAICEVKDPKAIEEILSRSNVGRMATLDEEGYPYITPLNFVFYQGCIYVHCAKKGEKLDNIARSPKVGFQVDIPLAYLEVDFDPEKNACHVHQLYHSVVIRGTAGIVPDGPRKVEVLNVLVAKHQGDKPFRPITGDMPNTKMCEVVEIRPERMTAKSDLLQKKSEEERRFVVEKLAERNEVGDLEAVRAIGYEVEGNDREGWRVKG